MNKQLCWDTAQRRELDGGFVLRTPANPTDVERAGAFNAQIHGPGMAALTTALVNAFPAMAAEDLVFVEDQQGTVVSSLCLIPWQLRYGVSTLQVGEMGIVGTAESVRRQGLVRAQVGYFKQRLQAHGCHLSLIQGIPYYYRQFGYTYAMPLEGGIRLEGRELPPLTGPAYTFVRATPDDLPQLIALYTQAAHDLTISAVRDAEHWRYMTGPMQGTELACELWLIRDPAGAVAGYLRLPDHHFGEELAVSEVSCLAPEAGLATLHQLVAWAQARGLPGVRLNLPENSTLVRLALDYGAHDLGRYAWQVYMPDLVAFLQAIVPTLAARLKASPLASWCGTMPINLFRQGAELHIAKSQITVERQSGPQLSPVSFPPEAFLPVVLGWRSIDEVRCCYPDVTVSSEYRLLLETLFPPAAAFLYTCT